MCGDDRDFRELDAEIVDFLDTHHPKIDHHGISLLATDDFTNVFGGWSNGNTAEVPMHQGGQGFGYYAVTVSDDDIKRLHATPLLDHIRNRGIANG